MKDLRGIVMNYLVTGHRGFVGRHLLNQLAQNCYYRNEQFEDVFGLDILSDYPTVEVLTGFLKARKIKKIFHLGARAFIPDCYGEGILEVLNSNTVFTANLLKACIEADIDKLVYMSTSEIYGSPQHIPINEEHPPNPQSIYSATKYAAENLCKVFSKDTGLDVIILRHFNIYGPRDTHPRVIPKIIKAANNHEKLYMGNINATRDFTYVDDATKALINVMNFKTAGGDIINHGTGKETSIKELLDMIQDIYSYIIPLKIKEELKRPWDIGRLCCDRSKYAFLFPDHEPIKMKEGLEMTCKWYKKVHHWSWEKNEQTGK